MRFVIPSDLYQVSAVLKQIMDECERHRYGESPLFAIKLALEEALINAVRHGNKCDCRKKVHVEAKVDPKRFEVTIEDEGPGFERTKVPDPREDENLEKLHGRGLLLMETYMDEVKYSDGGRKIHMVLKNDPQRKKRGE